MRSYRQVIEFANFICHFGENKVLLDYLNEIVLPAFLSGHRVRIYGGSRYLLLDVELVVLTSFVDRGRVMEPAIVGKFVMDTVLRRDQILVDGKLISDYDRLPSAPSAIFALTLSDHKLMYSKEVAGAPGLASFRTTIELLLKNRWRNYINEIVEDNRALRANNPSIARVTKRALSEAFPAPTVEIVAMAGSRNLRDFVSQFKVLKEVAIKVVRPNAEINNDRLFASVQAARKQVNSDATTLLHRNTDGLNKQQTFKQIAPAMDGNAIVTLRGVGEYNAKLSGSNEEVSVKEPLELTGNVKKDAHSMFDAFRRLIAAKILVVSKPQISPENAEKLTNIAGG